MSEEQEYSSLDEILSHNWTANDDDVIDYLIKMIVGLDVIISDSVRLRAINSAIYHHGGTVIEALIMAAYNKMTQIR